MEEEENIQFKRRNIGRAVTDSSLLITGNKIFRDNEYCEFGKRKNEYVFSPVSIILIIAQIILDVYLLVKYTSVNFYDESVNVFIIQIILSITFTMVGLTFNAFFANRRGKIESDPKLIFITDILGISGGAVVIIFQAIQSSITFSISPYDYFLFFLSSAISEETLFRAGIQPSFKALFAPLAGTKTEKNADKTTIGDVINSILSVGLTSIIFAYMHIFVYTDFSDLLIVFVMGCIFGTIVEISPSKNVDGAYIAHLFANILGGIAAVNKIFGGF